MTCRSVCEAQGRPQVPTEPPRDVRLHVTYYGYYEIRLYFQGADPDDPIVTAAGTVQTFLIRQVDNVGVWPFIAVFGALVAGAAIWRMRARRHRMPTTGGSGSATG